jgi:hypothetical protein
MEMRVTPGREAGIWTGLRLADFLGCRIEKWGNTVESDPGLLSQSPPVEG